MRTLPRQDPDEVGLNQPGFLYLNEHVLTKVKQAYGDAGKGTVDELKFGPLFERIAEQLFPWCSTLTTRARYYFFTYAILQLALERTIPPDKRDPQRDRRECEAMAFKLRGPFRAHLRCFEKYLTLSLHLSGDVDGAFGKRRARRWIDVEGGRHPVGAKTYERVLSEDTRFANVIYRSGTRELNLFISASANRALMTAQLCGNPVFTSKWVAAGAKCLAEFRTLVDFWERHDDTVSNQPNARLSLAEVAEAFRYSPAKDAFAGFVLSTGEAQFLYQQIQARTPYWNAVALGELGDLYADKPVTLADLAERFIGTPGHDDLEAAQHIDVVTRYWTHQYARIVAKHGACVDLDMIPPALDAIRRSRDWLDAAAATHDRFGGWKTVWPSYTNLVGDWISITERGDAAALANELMARAEAVVRERGKVAPHKRGDGDQDDELKQELDLMEGGFRADNANRLLADIAQGVCRGQPA